MAETDAIIIGAGAGGLAAAWRLTTRGVRVTLLESGRRFEPAKHYPQNGTDFESAGIPYNPVLDEAGRFRYTFGPEQPVEEHWRRYLSSGASERRPRDRRVYRQYSHVRGVGGSTLHFQGEAHRYHPDSLRTYSRFGVGTDWPISNAEIEHYYDLAESQIGVAAPGDSPFRPRTNRAPFGPHPLSYASQRLSPAFSDVGATLVPNALAVLPQRYHGRSPCNYCNSCSQGCPVGDKGSADVAFLPDALATGLLDLRSNTHAFRIETDYRGRASSVLYATLDGAQHRVRARVVILAAGAVETPRLLLLSAAGVHPDGIGNSAGQVGRNVTETLSWVSIGLHPERVDSYRGLPMDGSAWEFAVPTGSGSYAGAFRLATAHGAAGLRGPLGYARLFSGFGVEHQRRVAAAFGHGVSVAAIGEWLPNPSTRVTLDPEHSDRFGLRVPKITCWLDESERRLLRRMADVVRSILTAAGVKEILAERSALDTFEATHFLGTCRMSKDSRTGVSNKDGTCHEVPNLAFADGSLVPSSGWGDSPFLTITALAIRTADRLLALRGESSV